MRDDVVLTRLRPSDSDDLYRMVNNREIMSRTSRYRPIGYEEHCNWLKNACANPHYFAIRHSLMGDLLGTTELHGIDEVARYGFISIKIIPKYWKQGLAEPAVSQLIDYAFKDLGLNSVRAEVLEPNVASINLFTKLGFTVDGRHRQSGFLDGQLVDEIIFSLLRSDPRPSAS